MWDVLISTPEDCVNGASQEFITKNKTKIKLNLRIEWNGRLMTVAIFVSLLSLWGSILLLSFRGAARGPPAIA